MRSRPLGKTGITVSEIGFGTWGIGGVGVDSMGYGPADDGESIRALEEAFARGVNFFDTSNLYGWGHSERLLGAAFEGRREQVILATKAGFVDQEGRQDFSPDSIRRSLDGSLERLRTEYVDVLQLHNAAPEALLDNGPLWNLMEDLQRDRTIRCFGISARSPDDALIFARQYHPACLQVNFNLADLRALRNGLFDLCKQESIGVIVRTPLAFGFLTGRVSSDQHFEELDHRRRFSPETRARWAEAPKLYDSVFAGNGAATPAQNALRFCLSFDCVSTVIPGMIEVAHVRENVQAAEAGALRPDQLRMIDEIYDMSFA